MGTKSPIYCRHQYSELPISTTTTDSSDSSTLTYATPEYPSNEGIAYSMTPIYQQPLCNCHQASCPQQPQLPATSVSPDCHTESSLSTEKTLDSKQRIGGPPRRWKRGPLTWLWPAASLTLLFICVLCMTQPYWLVNGHTSEAIGLLSAVTRTVPQSSSPVRQLYDLLRLPSVCWKVSVALYSIATILLAIGTLLSFVSILLTDYRRHERLTFISGYVQLFAGQYHSSVSITQ